MDTADTHARPGPLRLQRASDGRGRAILLVAVLGTIAAVGLVRGARALAEIRAAYLVEPPAMPAPLDPVASLTDSEPVVVTVTTAAWSKTRVETTADAVLHDRSLWRQLHFEDWDRVARRLREPALDLMFRVYADILRQPATWRRMTVTDWDGVPQPVRAIAYLRMVAHWTRGEQVGAAFGLEPRRVGQSIGAIVMAESWFEHRAVNENEWGNRDLGLAQCSDYCRDEIAAMAERGAIAFTPTLEAYFNPLVGTRVATVWFARELERAKGDVELAIRAYHRGIENAYDERGDAYLQRVLAIRRRYVRNVSAGPSWTYLVERARLFSAPEAQRTSG